MSLNDNEGTEFDSTIEYETTYPTPATEIGELVPPRALAEDHGSGSFAEDGPIEVAEDDVTMDGEDPMIGSAAVDGPSEIGSDVMVPGNVTPYESFMSEPTRIGSAAMYGPTEIGDTNTLESQYEIGAHDPAHAVVKVVEKARDNRAPAPPMRVVDVDAPATEQDDWGLTDVFIGAAAKSGNHDPFPLTTEFMLRCGAGMPPRFVRVDTEETYKSFRTDHSPELSELAAHVAELEEKLAQHVADPEAHDALADDMEDLSVLGEEAHAAEDEKRVELWMPKRYDGLVTAWREGDFVCASLTLPGSDGTIRICTSLEPVRRCVAEMAKHASEAGVPARTVVGVLPAMGCVLGAGTIMKEVAAAAPEIARRPEFARNQSFMVRIEPKLNPAVSALAMLAVACKAGNAQACQEWKNLAALSPGPVKQAMHEALELAKAAS